MDDFTVHDITQQETPQISASGGVERKTIVRFFVGNHGPFQLEYLTADFTPDKARADIVKKVQELRTLTMSF